MKNSKIGSLGQHITGLMACDIDGVIGMKGRVPWSCSKDIQYFRNTTEGKTLVMGRKTFESLPAHFFDNRFGIIFSKTQVIQKHNCKSVDSLAAFIDLCKTSSFTETDLYMIGGGEVAELFLKNNLIDEFILTVMNSRYAGDTKLNIRNFQNWPKEILYSSSEFLRFKYLRK